VGPLLRPAQPVLHASHSGRLQLGPRVGPGAEPRQGGPLRMAPPGGRPAAPPGVISGGGGAVPGSYPRPAFLPREPAQVLLHTQQPPFQAQPAQPAQQRSSSSSKQPQPLAPQQQPLTHRSSVAGRGPGSRPLGPGIAGAAEWQKPPSSSKPASGADWTPGLGGVPAGMGYAITPVDLSTGAPVGTTTLVSGETAGAVHCVLASMPVLHQVRARRGRALGGALGSLWGAPVQDRASSCLAVQEALKRGAAMEDSKGGGHTGGGHSLVEWKSSQLPVAPRLPCSVRLWCAANALQLSMQLS
jgi:hypothetical protein